MGDMIRITTGRPESLVSVFVYKWCLNLNAFPSGTMTFCVIVLTFYHVFYIVINACHILFSPTHFVACADETVNSSGS